MQKLKLYGPVQDAMFTIWQVIGIRGGVKAEFYTKKDALNYIRSQKKEG